MNDNLQVDIKFKKRIMIVSRILAMLLILAIIYFGIVQFYYAKNVNFILSKYGSLGYCYLCGLETYRICNCQYIYDLQKDMINYSYEKQKAAEYNIQPCSTRKNIIYPMEINNIFINQTDKE